MQVFCHSTAWLKELGFLVSKGHRKLYASD
jgi:hypothetical protein